MNRIIIVCCIAIFLIIPGKSYSQVIKIDSLKQILATEKTDTATLKKYLVLAVSKLQMDNKDARLFILDWITTTGQKADNKQMVANSYYWKGTIHYLAGDMPKTVSQYTQALEYANSINYPYVQNLANMGLGMFYFNSKQYYKAKQFFIDGIAVAQKNNFNNNLSSAYLNLANVVSAIIEQETNPDYNEVIQYMKLSIEVAEKRKDTAVLLKATTGLGNMYNLKKEYARSQMYMEKAATYLSAAKWNNEAANFYGNLGEIYKIQKKYKPAIENLNKALLILKSYPDPAFEYQVYEALAEAYKGMEDFENAYIFQAKYSVLHDSLQKIETFKASSELENKYQQAIKDKEINRLSTEQKIKELEFEKEKALMAGNLAEAQRKEKELLLLRMQKENEIALLSQQKEIQTLEIQQQAEELEKKSLQAKADGQAIQLAQKDKLFTDKQLNSQRSTRNYLITGLSLLGVLAFFLIRNIIARKKAYVQLEDKSIQIKEQALELGKQAKQIAQFQSQMNPHFVYNALHNIQGLVLNEESEKANTQIVSLAQLMRKTFANAEKDDIPIDEEVAYLQKYIEFEKNAFENNLYFEVAVKSEAKSALIPPMMIQPFIENAIKHAELKKITNPYIKVLIEIENNLLSINIKDNGKGIEPKDNETDKLSHSISVIKSRLNLLFEGKDGIHQKPVFSIKTIPELSEGTSVHFYLPLNLAY